MEERLGREEGQKIVQKFKNAGKGRMGELEGQETKEENCSFNRKTSIL